MRALKRIREVPPRLDSTLESLLAQFSATTLELNPSLGATEFARRLTARAAGMFDARSAVLALKRGSDWETAAFSHSPTHLQGAIRYRLAAFLAEAAGKAQSALRFDSAAGILGRELAESLGWSNLAVVRLNGSEGSLLGVLALADMEHDLPAIRRQFLEALASHAAVALENVRLFSRIERSRKQWVEDVDAISDFLVVHDDAGHVLRLNRALASLLGLRPAAAVGRDIGGLELLGTPKAPGRCPFCHDGRAARGDFLHSWGERAYLVSSSRIPAGEDEEVRTVHVLKDITDRRDAERRYRHERDFNRNILNHTQSMILVLDTAGLVSYANRRCFQAGFCEADLLGHPFADLIPPARRPIAAEAFERALDGEVTDNLELPVLRGIDRLGQFSISLSPMRDEHGEINSIVVVMTDITDAATMQAKLMHTEKMAALGQLVSGVAHEVNNPLAAIVGFADLLLENPAIPEEARQELTVILEEAQRTRLIVQNLLSFARQMPPQREPVRVNAVLRQTLKLRAYDLASHRVEVIERYEEQVPLTIADPNQLQQVFLNILNNAFDAVREIPRRGRIEIATLRRDGHVEISFCDNGPGIANPERIFDPFYTTKEVGKGTGLGLSICYGIVRSHQGEILAQNHPDGEGCTFFVRLPAAVQGAEPPAAAEQSVGGS